MANIFSCCRFIIHKNVDFRLIITDFGTLTQNAPYRTILIFFLRITLAQSVNLPRYKAVYVPGPEVIKLFPCSTQLSTKLILLMNLIMPTIVGILEFISMINATSEKLKAMNFSICRY